MEEAVRAVEKAYDHAWQAGDIDGLLACLTGDATLMNPFGKMARGHAEIRNELSRVLRALGSGSQHESVISSVAFVTDDVAIVDGEVILSNASGEAPTVRMDHRFTDVLVRRNGEWLLAHIRAYGVFDPMAGQHVAAVTE